jgi:hypothetical protein
MADLPAEMNKQIELRVNAERTSDGVQRTNREMQKQIAKMEGDLFRITGKKRWTDGIAFVRDLVGKLAA